MISLYKTSITRHKALKHLRGRSAYVPKRAIPTANKIKAIKYWGSTDASPEEKTDHIEKNFKLTPRTQARLFQKLACPAKRTLKYRDEGAGRHMDEFWARIEGPLLEKFTARRQQKAMVHRRHLINWVFDICGELQINLVDEARMRGWTSVSEVIRKRVARFLIKHRIKKKKATRQLNKEPKVSYFSVSAE